MQPKIKSMFAIVEIAGKQYKVENEQELFVNKLHNESGDSLTFDKVLLVDNDGKAKIGTPSLKGASVSAKVLEHVKSDKIIVFKKKRRKGYAKRNGHRQDYTKIQIEAIKG
ncbi:MAG: large subunit ribosomal protein L21 [Bacteroidia bacterium]